MQRRLTLITLFVLLNMGIGRMFQESLGVTCFSELSILAITSFFFWNISSNQIKVWAEKWAFDTTGKSILVQGGIGFSATVINIFIGQLLVVFLMTTVYQCTSPSFNILNASLTNNVAVNLLCYFSLLFYFVSVKKDQHVPQQNDTIAQKRRVTVSKKGSQFLLEPNEIVYVETSNNCIVLHTEKGRFVKYQSLRSFSRTLCPNTFKRIHRSYLVNSEFIDQIQKNNNGDGKIHLKTGDHLKFSRTYLQELSHI
ncbi:LytR/AlgR family response regulator transcription factor [Flagellimonas meishanensis]|uniref:LytR/AlgR family response regulator transcription factor n=1 Tax=Flagellimonas meishanensis TaxID=2873264 RepID=UPI001CA6991B|nr:LytTR family DNA-binding domain-containing protein [[Muricauda] meishanensis]